MQTLDSHFDACLGRLHMGQNHDKKELLVRLMGKGAQLAMQRIYHGHIQVRGRCQRVCKYLGSLLHHSGATSPEVSNRIAVAKRNWAIMRKFWFTRGVAASQRRLVFLAMVVSPLYSGIEMCRLMMVTMSDLEECLPLWLENFAKDVPASSHTKMLTATIAACQIRLCLNFCKSFRLPGSAEPAVFSGGKASPGTLATMCRYWPQFLDNMAGKMGRLLGWMGESLLLQTHGCGNWWKIWTSWVSQIWWLTSHCRFFFHPCKDLFVNLPIRTLLVRKYREELAALGHAPVAAEENADEVAPVGPAPLRCDWIGADGAQCGYTAQSTTALSTHRHRLHGVRITARQIVVCNQCPWCRRIFASVEIAKRHAHARVKKGHCPRQGGNAAGMVEQLRPPPTFRCPVCPHEAVDLETLQTHVVGHVPAGQHVLHQYLIAAQQ